jgi:agmatine/peptidylarginine deiminase
MARRITVDAQSRVFVSCDNNTIQNSATTSLANAGCDMSRVVFVQRTLDSIWMRDYGPRYIYEGDCRAIIDHKYNRPSRVNDDVFPDYFSSYKKHAFYQIGDLFNHQLIHGGGNFHLDALRGGYATRLVVNENNPPMTAYSFPEAEIANAWLRYQDLDVTFFTPFPTSVDLTQHIDMWMQVIADDGVIISDWPNNSGSAQDQICDNAATLMASRGFTVTRVPAYSIGGTHYTFTNMVMCNNVVLVPSYTAGGGPATSSAAARDAIQAALPPGKTAYSINCQNIIGLAGAVHCIVMHVPSHRGAAGPNGGLAPTAYLQRPNGGETLTPGEVYTISWVSDDDAGVAAVDLLLSTDGGQTYPTTIASNQAAIGSYAWTVPNLATSQARVRVVARDAVQNIGSDESDGNFTIGAACYANCDGSTASPVLNVNDFVCFQQRFAAGDSYANCDGSTAAPVLNVNDFVCFQQLFAAGCP